jgi:Uma2 family endonuclease
MSTVMTPPRYRTMADLQRRLGGVPQDRILLTPAPGTATVADVIHILDHESRACELIDGVLVEKAVGYRESRLAAWLIHVLNQFVVPLNLGIVTGEQGTVQLMPDLVRIPDVAFTSWDKMPGRTGPTDAVPLLAPDLAVEVISRSNTPGEMASKRGDYFSAGVTLVWEIDPTNRRVTIFTGPSQGVSLVAGDTIDGGPVLPGLLLPVADLFGELDRHG